MIADEHVLEIIGKAIDRGFSPSLVYGVEQGENFTFYDGVIYISSEARARRLRSQRKLWQLVKSSRRMHHKPRADYRSARPKE